MGAMLVMVKCMKIVSPKISKYLEEVKLDSAMINNDLVDIKITDQDIDFKIENIEFNGCYFINVDFSKYPLKNISLIDCIFEKCNLSGSDFSDIGIHRVRFDRCNMVGCDFISSSLSNVSILETKGNYINFSNSKISHFEIVNSVVKEGRFVACSLEDVSFEEIDFERTEFLNTKLKGLDFCSCNINDIGVSPNDIRGVNVNDEQALMLISLFGIIIK